MKQVLSILILGLLAACNANDATVKSESTTDSTAAITKVEPVYPYTPSYSSKFEIGDPEQAKTLLDLQKSWDDNMLDNSKQFFADSVTIMSADGNMMSGPVDSIITNTKPYRNSLGTVNTKVHAWVPLRSTDKDENWVLVWYTEYHKKPNGATDSTELQETWRMNKAGKAEMMLQYEKKNPPAMK